MKRKICSFSMDDKNINYYNTASKSINVEDYLEYLIENYSGLVYHIVYNVLYSSGSKQDIEECVNDIFLFLWENIKKFDNRKSSIKTWISVISRSKAIDLKRKLDRRNEIKLTEDIMCKSSLEKILHNKDMKKRLLNAIKSLGEIDSKIFIYRYFYYEPIEMIAEKFKISRQAVDNRLHRGKKRIKKLLKEGESTYEF